MKFALKSLVAAAAIATVGLANAANITINTGETVQGVQLNGGSGTLSFSSGLIAALNVGKVSVNEVAPATVTEIVEIDPVFGESVRTGASAAAPIASVVLDDTTGLVSTVATTGGALQIAPRQANVAYGGSVSVTGITVDVINGRVYADMAGTLNAIGATPAKSASMDDFLLWTFDTTTGFTGPKSIDPANIAGSGGVANGDGSFSFNNTISNLKVTTGGYQFFVDYLGLLGTGQDALTAVNNSAAGWGTIASVITVTPAVPEPSTYALMGVGLLGVAFAVRRRAK